ncbi:MAG: polysaccharide deacetylase family protein [Clostridiales bacterium]|nr:polysaccharide deacetylase family protein [Clostridiales bacterium]
MKRVFASILVLSVISGLMAGCSNSTTVSRPFESTAGFSGKEATGSSEGDVSTIAPPSETSAFGEDSGTGIGASSDLSDASSALPADTTSSEATQPSAPEMTLSPNEGSDYLTMLQQQRQSIIAKASEYDALDNTMKESWCFQRKTDHSVSGSYEFFDIEEYNGYYANLNVPEGDKVIYLTFDCGYPSDKTVSILDTLKKHNAKASFFVTKMYLEECSDYAVRMKEEGHMVCNHTVTHSDLVPMTVEEIANEIFDTEEYFYEKTGYTLDPYFRTPKGTYTKRLMTILTDAGYTTVFWSIAYNDYTPSAQPEPGYVTDHFKTYHHNGAIALMHNDSSSNVNELDAVLTFLEGEGYRFGLLDELNQA